MCGPFSCTVVVVHWCIISWCCLVWLVLALHACSAQIVVALALLGRCESCFDACRGTKEQRCCTFWTAVQLHALASPLSWYLSPLNRHMLKQTERQYWLDLLLHSATNHQLHVLIFFWFVLYSLSKPDFWRPDIFWDHNIKVMHHVRTYMRLNGSMSVRFEI